MTDVQFTEEHTLVATALMEKEVDQTQVKKIIRWTKDRTKEVPAESSNAALFVNKTGHSAWVTRSKLPSHK